MMGQAHSPNTVGTRHSRKLDWFQDLNVEREVTSNIETTRPGKPGDLKREFGEMKLASEFVSRENRIEEEQSKSSEIV